MIIDKIYDIDVDFIIDTNWDYSAELIMKIIETINNFNADVIKFVVVGLDVYLAIENYRSFSYYVTKHRENVGNMELMGSLLNYNIYYDLKLKPNQVIVSDNMTETKQYIITKQRKEKLKKILKK